MKSASPIVALVVFAALVGCKKQEPASAPAAPKPVTAAPQVPPTIPDQEIAAPATSPASPARPAGPVVGRTWTSVDGRTMDAELIGRTEDSIRIRRNADGREFTLALTAISQADRDYVKTSAVPLTIVKRFDTAKLMELKKEVPRIVADPPLDPNYSVIMDLFGRYERDVRAINEVGFERHIRMLRERMDADIKRLEPITVTALRNPPVLTEHGWTTGGGSWKEVWSARACLAWLRGPMRTYVEELEKLK